MLVIGGSGSGKSAYAEEMALSLAEGDKYYLATMRIYDEEGRRKADRHRKQRSGKGFLTIEQPVSIHKAPEKRKMPGSTVLVECISNLAANEMFSGEKPEAEKTVVERVVQGIRAIKERAAHLVVVSNNVFEDGIAYDEETMKYIRAMGEINRRLAASANRVVEVVAGIPIVVKE